jgi:hypothetical protein
MHDVCKKLTAVSNRPEVAQGLDALLTHAVNYTAMHISFVITPILTCVQMRVAKTLLSL